VLDVNGDGQVSIEEWQNTAWADLVDNIKKKADEKHKM